MNTVYAATDRILRLKASRAAAARSGREDIPVRDEAYSDACKMYPEEPVQVQYAYGFALTLQRKKILIAGDDLLAGFIFKYTYNTNFPMKVSPDFDPAVRASLKMDVRREIREVRELIHSGAAYESADSMDPDSRLSGQPVCPELDVFGDSVESWLIKHWHSGHTLAGYERLLHKGFSGLLEEVRARKDSCVTEEEKANLQAFAIVTEACIEYIKRYETEAAAQIRILQQRMPEERIHEQRIAELENMRSALAVIRNGPPETFYQALQLLALAHEMMYCENVPSAVSIGRFDQYMYPFYTADIEAGRLTRAEAAELIDDFWLRCSSQRKAYQNLTLGGCGRDGKPAFNDLTYMCLDSAARLRVDQPSVNFRWTDGMTDEEWDAVIRLIRTGIGFPAIFYDPCCMKAQTDAGIDESEVWNYGFIGCVELAVPGRQNAYTELARINVPKFLDLFLHNGHDAVSGKTIPIDGGAFETYDTYEVLEQNFLREYGSFVRKTLKCLDMIQRLYAERYPLPYLSVLTEDCIGRGKDVNAGGAKYSCAGFNLCGLATAADSLAAIRRIVYEEKLISLDGFAGILSRDFEGREDILAYASGKCPKYGNDEGMPEETAARIAALTSDILSEYRTYLGGPYRLGLYSVEDHAIMGEYTGATADGRRRGVSLSNSMGASQGKDVNGPTALINSVTAFPMVRAQNGMVMDLKFLPDVIEGETGSNALRSLITSYFRKGGMEVQVSAVSPETLRDAQRRPEEHADLIVRVSGFSAYFTSLRKTTQDEIIERTSN